MAPIERTGSYIALNPHYLTTSRLAWLNQVTTDLSTSALFKIYAGVQPADVSSATTAANIVLASLTFPTTNAFGAASSTAAASFMTANAIGSDTAATAGTAVWFSLTLGTGKRCVDGSVGTSGADLNLNSTAIATNATVAVTAFTITSAV